MIARDLLNYFEQRLDKMIDSIKEIVEIESPSYDTEGSRNVVSWIENHISEVLPEAKTQRLFRESYGEHLIIRAFENVSAKNPVLLLGHTDTVHPVYSKNQNPTRIENGKLYGCGSFDMKANIILMLEILRAIKYLGLIPLRPVNILLTCDEEVGSETGRRLVEQEAKKAEFCLVFEPSAAGKVKTGRKGTGGYTLKTHGIPSHAGLEPEKGASAILELSKQIGKIHEITDYEVGTTLNIGIIKGGTATNVIPSEAECLIDVRFETLDEAERVENKLQTLKAFDNRVKLELLGEVNRPPLERTDAIVNLFKTAKKFAAEFDYELEETQVGGASDGNFVGALGIPLLDGLGIAGDGAHTLDEFVYLWDIPTRSTLAAMLLLKD